MQNHKSVEERQKEALDLSCLGIAPSKLPGAKLQPASQHQNSEKVPDIVQKMKAACEEIDRRDPATFLPTISDTFDLIRQSNQEVKYGKCEMNDDVEEKHLPVTVCTTGEIGNGKSSTGCHIIKTFCDDIDVNCVPYLFPFGRTVNRCTFKVDQRRVGDSQLIIDTPGVNDLKNALSDNKIYKMMYDTLGELFISQGVSSIVQCVMIGGNPRVKESHVDILFKKMHSLGYTHPDYRPLENVGPRICLVFTDFSIYNEEAGDIGIEGAMPEDADDIKSNKLSEIIDKLKTELVAKIYHEMGKVESKAQIEQKVDAILPDENFYAFKVFAHNVKRTEVERRQIVKLVSDCRKHGRRIVENYYEVLPMPTNFNEKGAKKLKEEIE